MFVVSLALMTHLDGSGIAILIVNCRRTKLFCLDFRIGCFTYLSLLIY